MTTREPHATAEAAFAKIMRDRPPVESMDGYGPAHDTDHDEPDEEDDA